MPTLPRTSKGFNFFRENSHERQRGFTLIELLIVIAIIGILMTIIFVSFSQAQKSARDGQRKSDLQTVAGILQRFYSDNSHYPAADSSGLIIYKISNCAYTATDATATWGTDGITCNSKTYAKQLPRDPIGTKEYCYQSADDQHYYIFANLEKSTGSSYSCNSTTYNYQVTSTD